MSAETHPEAAVIFTYRNELGQTLRELIAERIRAQGIAYNRDHPEKRGWRDKAWMDGITVDLDEDDELEYLVKGVTSVLREAMGGWESIADAVLGQMTADAEADA